MIKAKLEEHTSFKFLSENFKDEIKTYRNENNKSVFHNLFISPETYEFYKAEEANIFIEFIENSSQGKFNLNKLKEMKSFDTLYSFSVNNILSHLKNGENSGEYEEKLKKFSFVLLERAIQKIEINEEGKAILQKLSSKENLENDILTKVLNKDKPKIDYIPIEIYQILLYGIRFVIEMQTQKNTIYFYNKIIGGNVMNFIENNYIPGGKPFINNYIGTDFFLKNLYKQTPSDEDTKVGNYVCSCGMYYEIGECTWPTRVFKCPNPDCGLQIGGKNHKIIKREKHFRVFRDEKAVNDRKTRRGYYWFEGNEWMFYKDFKEKYVTPYLNNSPKGLNYPPFTYYSKNTGVRLLSEISYRILSFILYSHLLFANILGKLSDNELLKLLPNDPAFTKDKTYKPCFVMMINEWAMIKSIIMLKYNIFLEEFINIIFVGLTKILKEYIPEDSSKAREEFEKKVNDFIENKLSEKNKEQLEKEINNYKKINLEISKTDVNSFKELLLEHYSPELYINNYPNINLFLLGKLPDQKDFLDKLRLQQDYENKYILTKLVEENSIYHSKIKELDEINKMCNYLIEKNSYKIEREKAERIIIEDFLKDEAKKENININDEEVKRISKVPNINNFIEAWDKIKDDCTQYLCRDLKGIKTLSKDDTLNNFLVDEGKDEGGMYIASAYEKIISWQNNFISSIVGNSSENGILNSYIDQIRQEVKPQNAVEENIVNLEKKQKEFKELIWKNSLRKLFDVNGNLVYFSYDQIQYNFDEIEEQLGEKILPGLRTFKNEIDFVTYKFEEFRAKNTAILTNYNDKYPQRSLTNSEKEAIKKFVKAQYGKGNYQSDILSSLHILINYLQKERYQITDTINSVLESLPDFIEINNKLISFIKENSKVVNDKTQFTLDSLVSLFEFFEFSCWSEIKKNIRDNYTIKLSDEKKQKIEQFFMDNEFIKSKKEFCSALRKFISRYISGKRYDDQISDNSKLFPQLGRADLWKKETYENPEFKNEMLKFKNDFQVGETLDLYEFLGEDKEIYKEEETTEDNIAGDGESRGEKKEEKEKVEIMLTSKASIDNEEKRKEETAKNQNEINGNGENKSEQDNVKKNEDDSSDSEKFSDEEDNFSL